MASEDEEADLDALRLAVLASLKQKRLKNTGSPYNTDEDSSGLHDDELERLRIAALRSKREQNMLSKPSELSSSRPFVTKPSFFRDFNLLHKGYNRSPGSNPNLIVIQPVNLDEDAAITEQTILMKPQDRYSHVTQDEKSLSPRHKTKTPGKFSRFESDSSSSEEDDSESDGYFDSEELTKSPLSADGDNDNERDNSSDDKENENSELSDVLLLHPDENLQDNDHSFNINEESAKTEVKNGDNKILHGEDDDEATIDCLQARLHSQAHAENSELEHKESEKSDRRERDRSKRESPDDRRKQRSRDAESRRDERNRTKKTRDKVNSVANDRETKDRRHLRRRERQSERDRHTKLKDRSKDTRRHHRRRESCSPSRSVKKGIVECSGNAAGNLCIEDNSSYKKAHSRSSSNENDKSDNVSQDATSSSPPPSVSKSHLSDLREKLRSRGEKRDDRSVAVRSRTSQILSPITERSRSRSPLPSKVVRSVVTLSSYKSDSSSRKRSSPKHQAVKIEVSPPASPSLTAEEDNCEFSKGRKVLLLKDDRDFSDEDALGKSPKINVTFSEDGYGDSSPSRHKLPVHLRLGAVSIPQSQISVAKDSKRSSLSPSSVITTSESSSPKRTKKATITSLPVFDEDPPRRVKLKRDAFVSSAIFSGLGRTNGFSTRVKNQTVSGKTFESENDLDEKIRRIRANNQAIMKRKSEIEKDQQVNS